jgi:hypothetical protein
MKTLSKLMLGLGVMGVSAISLFAQTTDLEKTFVSPQNVQTSCYWYWLSGNISKQGVINDLKTMKQEGINRAFIGNEGLGPDEVPTGSVRVKSKEWWDCIHAALKTATDEGMEIGIFNGPGWSHMGGAWVKPEESMRYLGSQRIQVEGGKTVSLSFTHPSNFLSNVKVLAYKNKYVNPVLNASSASFTADGIDNAAALFDNNPATIAKITGNKATLDFKANSKDFVLRSVQIFANSILACNVSVEVKDGNSYREVKKFNVNRINMEKNTGYNPYAPVAEAIADAKGQDIRLVFTDVNAGAELRDIEISAEPVVSRFAEKILARMHQVPLPYWPDYKWATEKNYSDNEVVPADGVIDITSSLNGDNLSWNAPAGNWTIVRTYMAPTGIKCAPSLPEDCQGLEVDRWSKTALQNHYNGFMGEIRDKIPAADRKSWKVVVCDSYETASQNFGDDFFEYFKSHFGYDPTPYLLTYSGTVVGNSDKSERFLWDLRRMIADRLAYDNIGAMNKIAQKDGLHTWLESYGHWGFPGEFLQYGGQSAEVAGEFWSEGELGNIENRSASSSAHIYGKGKVSAESFTCGGPEFSRSPRDMKERGDRFFTEGINNTLLHVYVSQKDETSIPGIIPWFGNEFNRKNTWFNQLDLFTTYMKRCNLLLQNGTYVADVAYFIGEDAPVMTGLAEPTIPNGCQYDFMNAEVIEKNLTAGPDHLLSLPYGNKYKLLVLPPSKTMRPEVLKAIKKLIEDGAVVLGPRPEHSPSLQNYPQCDNELKALADEMWGTDKSEKQTMHKIGQGYLLNGYSIEQVFQLLGDKVDFQAIGTSGIKYCHITKPGIDIYFVANQNHEPVAFNAQFRIDGKAPELWQAMDGSIRDLKSYQTLNGTTTVPLRLASLESAFIVFRKAGNGGTALNADDNYPTMEDVAVPSNTWKVNFTTNYGFKKSITMNGLKDWTSFSDNDIKYLSGHGLYTSTFDLKTVPAGKKVVVDLGMVNNICKVKVNGKYVGGVWTPPYTVDITSAVKAGKNVIEVDVANNFCNRVIGDKVDPSHAKLTISHNSYTAQTQPQASGLQGPVKILCEK